MDSQKIDIRPIPCKITIRVFHSLKINILKNSDTVFIFPIYEFFSALRRFFFKIKLFVIQK